MTKEKNNVELHGMRFKTTKIKRDSDNVLVSQNMSSVYYVIK